jgi:hypothetical protein
MAAKVIITLPVKLDNLKKQNPNAKEKQAFIDSYVQEMITKMSNAITTTKNTMDLLTFMFGGDLDMLVAADASGVENGGVPLFNVQKMFLRMLKLTFPPNREVYMLNNDCLASYTVDESRQTLIDQLDDQLRRYVFLKQQYLENPEQQCVSLDLVNQYQTQAFSKLDKYMAGIITDYSTKIDSRDFTEFNNDRLSYILGIYTDINAVINGKCPAS